MDISSGSSSDPKLKSEKDKNMETQRTPLSSTDKNKQNMVEIWDSLGEPGRHGDFLVKYSPTPTTANPEFPSFSLITESPASSTSKNTQEIPTNNENKLEDLQEILKTMLPKYDGALEKIITEDDSKKDSPLPAYLSCPNYNVSEEENESSNSEQEEHFDPNEGTNQSDDAFSGHIEARILRNKIVFAPTSRHNRLQQSSTSVMNQDEVDAMLS
ncbi:hypothetical protein LXL04_008951 [Taraxacum kok-saghyz]